MHKLCALVDMLGLDPNKCIVLSSGGSVLDFTYQVSPFEFLSQAASDLHAGGASALLNSITNSRRAILCQMDRVLGALGWAPHSMTTKSKTDLMSFLGLPTPNILRKVGDIRNDLEHRYVTPPIDKVEDAHDIAMLFIDAVGRYMDTFWGEFFVGQEDELLMGGSSFGFRRELDFGFNNKSHVFRIAADRNDKAHISTRGVLGSVEVRNDSAIYRHCIRLAFTEISHVPVKEAIDGFFSALHSAEPDGGDDSNGKSCSRNVSSVSKNVSKRGPSRGASGRNVTR